MLDIEEKPELLEYLRSVGCLEPGESVDVNVLSGGVSGRTVLVNWVDKAPWVIKQAREQLQVPGDWHADPLRIEREADAMRVLNDILETRRVPKLVFQDRPHGLIAMQAVPEPFHNWKSMLMEGKVVDEHVIDFAQLIATIHIRSYQERQDVRACLQDMSFFEELRVEPYYTETKISHPELGSFFDHLVAEMRSNRITFVHGDYSPKNILVTPEGCVLIDHETAHWGDPAFDIGFAMTHFLAKALHLRSHRDVFEAAAHLFWRSYSDAVSGELWIDGLERRVARHLAACLLARVDGKSPLEYLVLADQDYLRRGALRSIQLDSGSVDALVDAYMEVIVGDI